MSTLAEFVASHLGQATDVDGAFGAQCVDLVQAWADATGTRRFHGNAADIAGQANSDTDWIPAGSGLPRPGDVMVWGPTPALGIGALGHVDIVVDLVGPDSFRGLDQNWINSNPDHGSPAALVMHIYEGVLGWHHFHALDIEEDEMKILKRGAAAYRLSGLGTIAQISSDQLTAYLDAGVPTQDVSQQTIDTLMVELPDAPPASAASVAAIKAELDTLASHSDPAVAAAVARIEAALKQA